MNERIPTLRKKMEKAQDKRRFEHTLSVSYTAGCLAMCNGIDPEKAEIAGLLHDCAKCLTDEKRIQICEKNAIEINEIERKNPFLLHAKAGAYLAENQYDIHDQDILNAIRFHTTGRPGMTLLEKIVFIADYIEPGRTHSTKLPELRKLAFQDIERALIEILSDTLIYLNTTEAEIDPMTKETYDYYHNKKDEKI